MKTVFTNGCFDIIHAGHVDFLRQASELGQLTVWLNSDESVRARKGPGRPLQPFEHRRMILESIKYVDFVNELDAPNMVHVFGRFPCDIWVKGGDYHPDTINRAEMAAAKAAGVEFVVIPIEFQVHTHDIICKLSKRT